MQLKHSRCNNLDTNNKHPNQCLTETYLTRLKHKYDLVKLKIPSSTKTYLISLTIITKTRDPRALNHSSKTTNSRTFYLKGTDNHNQNQNRLLSLYHLIHIRLIWETFFHTFEPRMYITDIPSSIPDSRKFFNFE